MNFFEKFGISTGLALFLFFFVVLVMATRQDLQNLRERDELLQRISHYDYTELVCR